MCWSPGLAAEVPAVVLRAAVIIGSGSASFEMLRYLTERLPVMVTADGKLPGDLNVPQVAWGSQR